MVNRTPGPLERPHNWCKQGRRSLVYGNEPDVAAQLNLVPATEGPSELLTDPKPDPNIPSHS